MDGKLSYAEFHGWFRKGLTKILDTMRYEDGYRKFSLAVNAEGNGFLDPVASSGISEVQESSFGGESSLGKPNDITGFGDAPSDARFTPLGEMSSFSTASESTKEYSVNYLSDSYGTSELPELAGDESSIRRFPSFDSSTSLHPDGRRPPSPPSDVEPSLPYVPKEPPGSPVAHPHMMPPPSRPRGVPAFSGSYA
jgi:hypothetical protein